MCPVFSVIIEDVRKKIGSFKLWPKRYTEKLGGEKPDESRTKNKFLFLEGKV